MKSINLQSSVSWILRKMPGLFLSIPPSFSAYAVGLERIALLCHLFSTSRSTKTLHDFLHFLLWNYLKWKHLQRADIFQLNSSFLLTLIVMLHVPGNSPTLSLLTFYIDCFGFQQPSLTLIVKQLTKTS